MPQAPGSLPLLDSELEEQERLQQRRDEARWRELSKPPLGDWELPEEPQTRLEEGNPYALADEHRRQQREAQATLRMEIANQLQHDPAEARRILAVSSVTGLEPELVAADLPNLERQLKEKSFDIEHWRATSPAWFRFTSKNQYHLAVLQEDQEGMGWLEKSFRQLGMAYDNTVAQVQYGRLQARRRRGKEYWQEDDAERLKELDKLMVAHDFGAEGFARFLVKNVKMAGPTVASLWRGAEWGLAGATSSAIAVAYAGQTGPLIGVPEEIATVPAAALTGGLIAGRAGMASSAYELESGFAYGEYIDMGMDHETAARAANMVGVANMALESFSLGVLTKYVPGLRRKAGKTLVAELFKQPSIRKITATAGLRFGEVLGTEVVTEALQESITAVIGEIARPEGVGERLTLQNFTDRITSVMLETMQGAFLMSSIGPVGSYYTDMRNAYDAKQMAHVYRALGEDIEESNTRKTVPEKFREFVDELTKDGPLKHLIIDRDRFIEYWQEQGQDPEAVAKELGLEKGLEASGPAGTDIELPIGPYAEKVAATEHHAGLMPDLKAKYTQMSARESKIWYANADKIQRAIFDGEPPDTHVPVGEIYETVLNQLVESGIEHTAAESKAALTEYIFSTLAKRTLKDPLEFFKKYWGGVQKDRPEIMGKIDIDVYVDPLLDMLRVGEVPNQRDIYGESLVDFLFKAGGLLQDAELDARDVAKEFPQLMRRGKLSLEAAAEIAFEAGFIPEYDTDQLLGAIDQLIAGEQVFGRGADPEALALSKRLEDLGDMIDQAGLDLATMTNAEIRAALQGELVLEQMEIIEVPGAMPDNILAEQDFGDLKITVDQRIAGRRDQFVGVSQPAQTAFDNAVARLKSMQDLLECVNA